MRQNRPAARGPETAPAAYAGPAPPPSGREVPRIEAQRLFGPFSEVRIQYRGTEYRLRITKNEKLILTK